MTTRPPKIDAAGIRRAAFTRGLDAEAAAGALLAAQGFAVIASRVRTARGEIDLIAQRETLLVFVEVKARARIEEAAEAVSPRQRKRIVAAAEIFLAEHPEYTGFDMRLDAILIAPGEAPLHLPAAFEAE